MQLLFLYIQDHHTLSGQNLNFGGQFRFYYDQQLSTLKVSENPQHIDGFFTTDTQAPGDARLHSFSAIIGQNGTGKTSILNFIKEQLTDGARSLRLPILLAVKTEEGKVILYRSSDIPLLGDNLSEFGIVRSILSLEQENAYASRGYRDEEDTPFLSEVTFVNFSNVFDGSSDQYNTGLRDISTDHLLKAELNHETTMRIQDRDYSTHLDTFRRNETERQIDFINFFETKKVIPFKLPEKLTVTSKRGFSKHNYLQNIKEKGALEQNQLLPVADRIVQCLEETPYENNGLRERVVAFFYVQSLLNFLQEMALAVKGFSPYYSFTISEKKLSRFSLEEINNFLIEQLEKKIKEHPSIPKLLEMANAVRSLHEYIAFAATGEEVFMQSEGRSFELDIDNEQFQKLYACYKLTFDQRPYLNFDWRSISSGEKAFLNIYSRFFSLSDLRTSIPDKRLSKNIVILIDEGDLYLHPEWQRRFVFLLCEFLTKVYRSENGVERNVQVIFTSNSPIPVSDLPNGNVIFLQKLNGETVAKDSLEDKKQTFGANIHTLLSDGFFLSHGLMGEFAKQKINSIIEVLQDKPEKVMEKREMLEKNISLIGEPLIRTKLVQMFTEKLQMNMMDVDQRLSYLEQEIRMLKANQPKP